MRISSIGSIPSESQSLDMPSMVAIDVSSSSAMSKNSCSIADSFRFEDEDADDDEPNDEDLRADFLREEPLPPPHIVVSSVLLLLLVGSKVEEEEDVGALRLLFRAMQPQLHSKARNDGIDAKFRKKLRSEISFCVCVLVCMCTINR